MKKYCGIDISAYALDLASVDEEGNLISILKCENKPKEFEKVHKILISTGIYGETLARFLCTNNLAVYVINPYQIKSFRERSSIPIAIGIAEYMRIGEKAHHYTHITTLQSLTRLRFSLVDTLVAIKNELHSIDLFSNKFSATALAILEKYPFMTNFCVL